MAAGAEKDLPFFPPVQDQFGYNFFLLMVFYVGLYDAGLATKLLLDDKALPVLFVDVKQPP